MHSASASNKSHLLQRRAPGRPPLDAVRLHPRVFDVLNELWHQRFLQPAQMWRGLLAEDQCAATFDRLLTGHAKASAPTLKAVAVLGHALGLRDGEILIGKVIPSPDRQLLVTRLQQLDRIVGTTLCSQFVQERIAALTAAATEGAP